MIAFGVAVTKPEVFAACAEPGLTRCAEPDSIVDLQRSTASLLANYNALLDRAAAVEGLEALVLLHQDTEIVDAHFCDVVRRVLADPEVGIVGCVGAVGVRSIAWWEGSVTCASFTHRYAEHGGGDVPSFSWTWADAPVYARLGEVDTLDGFLLVLSPWVVRNLRFDESLGALHGYDLDFCLQVREAGLKAVTADFRAIHHHSLELISEPATWIDAHVTLAEKWDGRMPQIGTAPGSWRDRVLAAEAERDAARLVAHRDALNAMARVAERERELEMMRTSISWRLTAPLRRRRRHRPLETVQP